MVDISRISGHIMPEAGKADKASKADGSFGRILDETLKGQAPQTAGLEALGPPMAIQPMADMESAAVEQADRLLGLLEQYAQELENPHTTLKALSPMVDQMELEAGAARRVLSHLDAQDKLGRLVNQAAVQASVEAFKFRRGDYV